MGAKLIAVTNRGPYAGKIVSTLAPVEVAELTDGVAEDRDVQQWRFRPAQRGATPLVPFVQASRHRERNRGEVEQRGLKTVRDHLKPLQPALRKPYLEWLDEAHYIVHLRDVLERITTLITAG